MIDAMRNDINEYQKNPADFEVASYRATSKFMFIYYYCPVNSNRPKIADLIL